MENNYDEDQPMVCPHCEPEECTCLYDHSDMGYDMSDVEADADTLKSAGMGTDEDYRHYDAMLDEYSNLDY